MGFDNQFQIDSIQGEAEYIMDLLRSTLSESARNALMERLRTLMRSMAALTVSAMPLHTQGNPAPQPAAPQPAALQPPSVDVQETPPVRETKRVFTAEELALYNGLNGHPAYVAVNGIVYDVSHEPIWQTLTHFGMPVGRELSVEFNTCHSNKPFLLDELIPVGRMESGNETLV